MIYLDYQASAPLAPEARAAMLPWLGGPESTGFGNPHSPHRYGRLAHALVEAARQDVAALLPPGGKVIFTSGATEALNLGLRGLPGAGPIAISGIEHAAVGETAGAIGPLQSLAVTRAGLCPPDQPLAPGIRAVCVMQINNEIGTIQPLDEWREAAHRVGALLVVDAAQAYGKMALAGADLIAISAHKMHGPKGIGALWVREGVALSCQSTGGGQEQGLRSGTLSPALIAGFGAAARLAAERMAQDAAHVARLWARAREVLAGWRLNGCEEARWRGNLNLCLPGLDVARLMSECREIAFSAGSACASGSGRPSHVLRAIGLEPAAAKSSIRLGFGRYTTLEELETAAETLNQSALQQAVHRGA